MKFRNIFWGVVLIFVGVLFILQNLHVIHFDWMNLWRLWPVVLVLWGVSILPANSWIKLILTLLILSASIFFMVDQTSPWDDYNYDSNVEWWDDWDSDDATPIDQYFDVPFDDTVSFASLNMDAAAGSFVVDQTTDKLMQFDKRGAMTNYSYIVKTLDDKTEVMIEPEEDKITINRKKNKNSVNLSLNTYPVWTITMDVGASSMNFDLTPYKVKKLDIDGGAASFKFKLGDNYEKTDVNIDAGASSIKLMIPESSGCDLRISTVLSGRDINGFEKIEHGHYQTENFESASNKIFINVDAAVSSYSITRY
jgi:hypothetical protein